MPLAFDAPLWLWLLLAIPVLVWLGRNAPAIARPKQHRAAIAVRATAVGLLALGLAAPRWESRGEAVDVAFLVDVSDSVGSSALSTTEFLAAALAARGGDDRSALALFGEESRLEYSLRIDAPQSPFATVVDTSASDIARALRLGQGVLGSEHRRRVVLFTDGRQTQGDAVAAAEELAAAGIRVDVVPLAAGDRADVLIEEVRAPSSVREGETYDVVGVIRNTGSSPAEVVVVTTADGTEVDRREQTVDPGVTEVAVTATAEQSGTVRYEMRLGSGASSVAQNDLGRAAVQVDGPPRVLVYEGEQRAGAEVAAALEASLIPVDLIDGTVTPFPPLDRLLDYDSVVLVDVPAAMLGETGMTALDATVRDAGHGLVAIGGDDAYGMGGYDATPLEDLLPVFARVKDPERRPSVAEALVVDISGSMAACHCRPDGFAGGPGMAEEGGVNKTDITKEAVARAVQALTEQDTVGVLAFNAEAQWVLPLQSLPSQQAVDEALARLHPDGPTDVVNALEEAIAGLKDVNARLRHIVLFTDGFSEDPAMVEAARKAADAGITLSVVATGEGTGEVLEKMAEAGGGRFYPGRDLLSIPDIIVSEVQFAARPIIQEGEFTPILAAVDPLVDGLRATPPLLGYLATTEKPTARALLRIGEERDPLLATWQAGVGTAVAWTSDATSRWSSQWVPWEQYPTFWADVVKSTFPTVSDTGFGLSASVTGDEVVVEVGSQATIPEDVTGTAIVTLPDGTKVEVDLQRSSLDTFTATVPAGMEGVYAVTVRLQRGDTDVYRDATSAIRAYSPEYAIGQGDLSLIERVAAAGGGVVDPAPETVYDPAGLEPGRSSRELWPWLALLALLLLVTDVGLRRLRLERGDLSGMLRRGRSPGPSSDDGAAASQLLRSRRERDAGTTESDVGQS